MQTSVTIGIVSVMNIMLSASLTAETQTSVTIGYDHLVNLMLLALLSSTRSRGNQNCHNHEFHSVNICKMRHLEAILVAPVMRPIL